jgi:hypothetical protein
LKAIEQMFVSQASFLYVVVVQTRTPPPAVPGHLPGERGGINRTPPPAVPGHLPGERGGIKKAGARRNPGPGADYFRAFFLTVFLTAFLTAFFTAFAFFLAAIFLTSFF